MQRESVLCLVMSAVLVLLPTALSAQVVALCDSASTPIMGGEYIVMNNVWGASTPQCLEVALDSAYFRVTLSEHDNGTSVASYPAIFKGCHWGTCTATDNPMPLRINEIESAPFSWVVNTSEASGTWNTALDIWFAPVDTGSHYSAEMMIWIDYHGGAAPAGSKYAEVEIGTLSWEVYFVAWSSWNYIAYKIVRPVDSVSLDLKRFIDDAVARGYLDSSWYLHAVEAGFEIWKGGQGLTTRSFSADVKRASSQ